MSRLYLVLLGGVLFLLLVRCFSVASYAGSNLGMVLLNNAVAVQYTANQPKRTLDVSWNVFHHVTQLPSAHAAGWRGLGLVTALQGNWEQSRSHLDKFGVDSKELVLVGNLMFNLRRYEEALFWYGEAIQLNPEDAEAWLNRGNAFVELGNWEAALEAYQIAWQYNPGLSARKLALAYEHFADLHALDGMLEQTLISVPAHFDRWWWWYQLGESLRKQEQWDEAIGVYHAALEEFPGEPSLAVGLAWAHYERGDGVDAVLKILQQAAEMPGGRAVAYFNIAEVMNREQRFAEADGWYEEAIAVRADYRPWHFARANNARQAEDLELAINLYREIVQRYPDYANAYYELARTYQKAGRSDEAVTAIHAALERVETSQPRYFMLAAQIYEQRGEIEQARQAYKSVLELDPDHPEASQELERLYQNGG